MNIGQASDRSGVSAKMIRYYESVGLLPSAARRPNGYRDYGDQEVAVLQFVRRTRDLGFSLDEVSTLLALWSNKKRPSRDVKRMAERHIADLEHRISEMRTVMRTLRDLAKTCHGDERSDCPILDDFAAPKTSITQRRKK
ncbi:MAG: Cu(I)-responsive transcriptional regulator [Hyphomonadaceae bacterium]|nr:Cu(I)-responsive transcriptional regulator [Hyphomonadaceae bacterium]